MDPTYAVQVALVDRLKDLGTAAGTRVFDSVAKGRALPYITVGPVQTVPLDEECTNGSDLFVTVNVWSREAGLPESEQIAGAIRTALDGGALTLVGHLCERMYVASMDFSRETDGATSRALIELVITTQPA